jgi:hypothetical protein
MQKHFTPGSANYLIATEMKYGGLVSRVARNKVSPLDHRTDKEIVTGGMIGGDRMLRNGYATKYSEYLRPLVTADQAVTVAEFGILEGTGLAMWSDLFSDSRIMGFDIDLQYTRRNMKNLRKLGAFDSRDLELYEYDQLLYQPEFFESILSDGQNVDIVMDDGLHSEDSIMRTLESIEPYLAEDFIYFIEDNSSIHLKIRDSFPSYFVDSAGALTVLTPRNHKNLS